MLYFLEKKLEKSLQRWGHCPLNPRWPPEAGGSAPTPQVITHFVCPNY